MALCHPSIMAPILNELRCELTYRGYTNCGNHVSTRSCQPSRQHRENGQLHVFCGRCVFTHPIMHCQAKGSRRWPSGPWHGKRYYDSNEPPSSRPNLSLRHKCTIWDRYSSTTDFLSYIPPRERFRGRSDLCVPRLRRQWACSFTSLSFGRLYLLGFHSTVGKRVLNDVAILVVVLQLDSGCYPSVCTTFVVSALPAGETLSEWGQLGTEIQRTEVVGRVSV